MAGQKNKICSLLTTRTVVNGKKCTIAADTFSPFGLGRYLQRSIILTHLFSIENVTKDTS